MISDLAAILTQSEPWMDDALCAQVDPEAFFPEKGGSTRAAKGICAACPVRERCLEFALKHDERFGIWGGKSERERRKMQPVREPGDLSRVDVDAMRRLLAEGLTDQVIAERLGCSPETVGRHRRKQKATSSRDDEEEDDMVEEQQVPVLEPERKSAAAKVPLAKRDEEQLRADLAAARNEVAQARRQVDRLEERLAAEKKRSQAHAPKVTLHGDVAHVVVDVPELGRVEFWRSVAEAS